MQRNVECPLSFKLANSTISNLLWKRYHCTYHRLSFCLACTEQLLFNGEAHEVLPGNDAGDLEVVVDHDEVAETKAAEDVVRPVETEATVDAHSAAVDEGSKIKSETFCCSIGRALGLCKQLSAETTFGEPASSHSCELRVGDFQLNVLPSIELSRSERFAENRHQFKPSDESCKGAGSVGHHREASVVGVLEERHHGGKVLDLFQAFHRTRHHLCKFDFRQCTMKQRLCFYLKLDEILNWLPFHSP